MPVIVEFMLKNRKIFRVCRKRHRAAQKAGMSYVYDEDGTLIAQTLTGGASTSWGQSARYIYLPTAGGPMPVAAIYGTKHYAIQSDHLNTPRRLIQSDGQVAWQWSYSAFGEEKPTIAKTRFANADLNQSFGSTTVPAVTFNLRYPGQYFDQESNLHYNWHRSMDTKTGRYSQSDPIGLRGGWNMFSYANFNPLSDTDPTGLFVPANHNGITVEALRIIGSPCAELPGMVALADFLPYSQDTANSHWHAMSNGAVNETAAEARAKYEKYVDEQLRTCTCAGLARALHAIQDSYSPAHAGFQPWDGSKVPSPLHVFKDSYPSKAVRQKAVNASVSTIRRYKEQCTLCQK